MKIAIIVLMLLSFSIPVKLPTYYNNEKYQMFTRILSNQSSRFALHAYKEEIIDNYQEFSDAVKENTNIHELMVMFNVDDKTLSILKAFKKNTNIDSIYLFGISSIDYNSFFEIIKDFKHINKITFDIANINDEESKFVSQYLMENDTLQILNLAYNKLSDEGAISICKALILNTTLTGSKIARNQITDNGAISISEALILNKSLIDIDFSFNRIGELGSGYISKVIEANKNISFF